MAITKTQCLLALAMLVIVGTSVLGVSAQCEGSIPGLVSQCSQFVKIPGPQIPPSAECCLVVKGVDIPCFCKFVTPRIERIVSMEKVVYVARTCGLTIKPGTHCGSYTVPPSASASERNY